MRIAGMTLMSHWAHTVLTKHHINHDVYDDEAGIGTIVLTSAELLHGSMSEHYRPFLRLAGKLTSVATLSGLGADIDEVTFALGDQSTLTVDYHFTREQMAEMVQKGLFTKDFTTVDVEDLPEWDIPVEFEAIVVQEDDGAEHHVPLVFLSVKNSASLVTDLDKSEYDLVEIFKDVPEHGAESEEEAETLFTGESLLDLSEEEAAAAEDAPVVAEPVAEDAPESVETEHEDAPQPVAPQPLSEDDLYNRFVKPVAQTDDDVELPQPVAQEQTDVLDLSEDEAALNHTDDDDDVVRGVDIMSRAVSRPGTRVPETAGAAASAIEAEPVPDEPEM